LRIDARIELVLLAMTTSCRLLDSESQECPDSTNVGQQRRILDEPDARGRLPGPRDGLTSEFQLLFVGRRLRRGGLRLDGAGRRIVG